MIEVLFGESEAASMKEAKKKHFLLDGDDEQNVIGGMEDVICLGFLLDIGDIRETTDSTYRKNLIYSMYAQNQWQENDEFDKELRELGSVYNKELSRLKEYLSDGETVRIWYSENPYAICGFYHLCSILKNYRNKVFIIKLPEYTLSHNAIISYNNWGEVVPEKFVDFLSEQKELSLLEVQMNAEKWNELKEDNSCLRAMVNGRILGVSEDFYDFLLWKRITKRPEKQARMIGEILGFYCPGIGDWWFAKRIDYYIQTGKIKVMEDSENKYARVLCLS